MLLQNQLFLPGTHNRDESLLHHFSGQYQYSYRLVNTNHVMEMIGWNELRLTLEESRDIVGLRLKQKVPQGTMKTVYGRSVQVVANVGGQSLIVNTFVCPCQAPFRIHFLKFL
jgi:hypothetical protein